MRKSSLTVFSLLGLVLLGACNRQAPVPAAGSEAPAETQAPVAKPPAVTDAVTTAVAALGNRVSVRYDRTGKAPDGDAQRQVFMEVVAGTPADVEAALAERLLGSGYVKGRRFEDAHGARQLFRKRNDMPVRTLTRIKGVGPALKDPRAVGSIYLTR